MAGRKGVHHSVDQSRDPKGRWMAREGSPASQDESSGESDMAPPHEERGRPVIVIDDSDDDRSDEEQDNAIKKTPNPKAPVAGKRAAGVTANTGADLNVLQASSSRQTRPGKEASGKAHIGMGKQVVGTSSDRKMEKKKPTQTLCKHGKEMKSSSDSTGASSYDTYELQETLDAYGDKFHRAEKLICGKLAANEKPKEAVRDGLEWLRSEMIDLAFERPTKKRKSHHKRT